MTDSPDRPPARSAFAPVSRWGLTFSEAALLLTTALVGLGLLLALLLPYVQQVRTPSRPSECKLHLKQIALAFHDYADEWKSFPPAYTVDAEGRPLHSWRTLILPYLEHRQLYDSIDLSKPWDHPANAHARNTALSIYRCPSAECSPTQATYRAAVAPGSWSIPISLGNSHRVWTTWASSPW